MNLEAIKKTAIQSVEDGGYVVKSPLCPMVMGVGDTPDEAWRIFHEMLDEHYEGWKAGRVARGPGRPKKGKTRLHAEVDPDVKTALAEGAKGLGISQGEMIEYLFELYRTKA